MVARAITCRLAVPTSCATSALGSRLDGQPDSCAVTTTGCAATTFADVERE